MSQNCHDDKLRNKFQFYKSLKDIDDNFDDNKEFIDMVKKELFSDMICVYCSKGEVIQLPKGSSMGLPIQRLYCELERFI